MNTVYLRRKNKIILPNVSKNENTDLTIIATALKNLEALGYTLSKEVIEVIKRYGNDQTVLFYKSLVKIVRELTGANKAFNPMYPNFPDQVMNASDAELYINAMIHYFGSWLGVCILPKYEKEKRSPLVEKSKLTVIGLGSKEDLFQMFRNLMESKTSISESDKADLAFFMKTYSKEIKQALPEIMPNKEILAFVAGQVLSLGLNQALIVPYFKTATDVLRLAVAMSGGDVSLAENTKFRNFKRPERRMIVSLLEKAGKFEQITEDMLRFKNVWIRLGERLHVKELDGCVNSKKAFDVLRNNKKFITTNSKIESALSKLDIVAALDVLKWRPGDFARRLDQVLSIGSIDAKTTTITQAFAEVVSKVSTPVLLQVMNHFQNRDEQALRVFIPKGNIAKIQTVENKRLPLASKTRNEIIALAQEALIDRFSKLGDFGKVYLDPDLKKYYVPFSQRSASKALKTLVRGSRIPMTDKPYLRFFIWWKNISKNEWSDRVDIDLTATAFDKDWNKIEDIAYYNLRESYACHSGDIVSAPNGACEFIDIDIPKAKDRGIRYIVQSVYSYTTQPYCNLPECFAGFMTRQDPQNGKIFDARTVENKIDLASNTKVVVPMIFDLEKKEMIWADMGLAANQSYGRVINANDNSKGVTLMCRAVADTKRANLFDLFSMHCKGRKAEMVTDITEADMVFTSKDIEPNSLKKDAEVVTPFDIDVVMAKYL